MANDKDGGIPIRYRLTSNGNEDGFPVKIGTSLKA